LLLQSICVILYRFSTFTFSRVKGILYEDEYEATPNAITTVEFYEEMFVSLMSRKQRKDYNNIVAEES